MCGRYVHPDQASIERAWHVGRANGNPFAQRFNVTPTMQVPMLRWDVDSGSFELMQAHWGFVPHWWKEAKPPRHTINARSEEIATKPMWRTAFRHTRCLLPAVGWYEWQPRQRVDPHTGEIAAFKQPFFIRPVDGKLFAFAAIYSPRGTEDGSGSTSCAILTRASVEPLTQVHDRMPVVLDETGIAAWIDPDQKDVQAVIAQHTRADFHFSAVSTRVNQRGAEGEGLIEPVPLAG